MSLTDAVIAVLPAQITRRIEAIPMARRLARGAFWTSAGSVAARALNMPASIILARLMGPTQYGQLGIINSSIELFFVFASFGLGLTAIKYVAQFRVKDPARAGRILALSNLTAALTGGCFSLVLFFLAPWMASTVLVAPQLAGLLRIGALMLFFAALNGAQGGALYGFEAFRISAQLQVLVGLLNTLFMIGGYYLGKLEGILYGMLLARIIDWLLRHLALRREARRAGVPIVYGECIQELAVLWRFSVPAVMSGALVSPVHWLCSAMLVNQPKGYEEMGVYNAASQWYGALVFLPVVLGSSLLPLLSDRLGHGDAEASRKVLSFMLRLNSMIVVPCILGISILSPYIMRAYGHGFSHAWPTLIVVVITAGIYVVLAPVGDVIAASGRMWLGCAMNAGWGLVFICGSWLFVGRGSFGLAFARLLAYAIHATWTLVFAYRVMDRMTGECRFQEAPLGLQSQ
jgi:O-antigen/teichoic acid export membrane protein